MNNKAKNLHELFPECENMTHDEMFDILQKCETQCKKFYNDDYDYMVFVKTYHKNMQTEYKKLYAYYHGIVNGDIINNMDKNLQSIILFENLIKYVYMRGMKARITKEVQKIIDECVEQSKPQPPTHETT